MEERQVEPSWADLFITDQAFDISKFQLGVFSLIVGVALASLGVSSLESFTIPDSMLGILGLSQVVYVGGKAVTPPSMSDYGKKLDEVRRAETAFRDAVAEKVGDGDWPANINEAKKKAMKAYLAYMTSVRQAAFMHEQIFGVEVKGHKKLDPAYE